jgi:hypothetical protein
MKISVAAPLATLYGVAKKHLKDKNIDNEFTIRLSDKVLDDTYGTTLEQAKISNVTVHVELK